MTRIRAGRRPVLPTLETLQSREVPLADPGSRAPLGSSGPAGRELRSQSVDLYGTAYGNFATKALEQVRLETYGEDFGQSSWVTGAEYRRFCRLLQLRATDHVLDVGCGSGGPALFLAREAGCRVTGVDVSEAGIQAGLTLARRAGLGDRVHFRRADVRESTGSGPVLQPIMQLDLPVKVRPWELTVYPRSYIRRRFGATRPAKART